MTERPRSHLLWKRFGGSSAQARARRTGLLVSAALLGLLHLRAPLASLSTPYVWQKDLVQVHALAEAVSRRASPYNTEALISELGRIPSVASAVSTDKITWPPTAGLLMLPLVAMPYEALARLWLVLSIACLLGSVTILTTDRSQRSVAGVAMGLALVAWYPIWQELIWGQTMLIILFLSCLSLALWRRGRSVVAGIPVGLSLLLKPTLFAVPVLFAMRRDWRAVWGSVASAGVAVVATVTWLGPETWYEYFRRALPDVLARFGGAWANVSLWAPLWRARGATAWQASGTQGWLLAMGVAALSVVGLALATRALDREHAFGIALAASAVLPPIAWPHYLVLCLVPLSQVWGLLHRWRFPKPWTNLALASTLLLACDWVRWSNWLAAERTLQLFGQSILLPALDLRPLATFSALALLCLLRSIASSSVTSPQSAVER